MTDETNTPQVAQGTGRRKLIVGIAMAVIAVCGWSIWNQIAEAQRRRPVAQRVGSSRPFDLSNPQIPVDRIFSGGVPKDGIPALTAPKFVRGDRAPFMAAQDRVVGVAIGEQAKVYPLKILDFHEAVNDRLAGESIAVTYCPLCDSSAVFRRKYGNAELEFGISGKLFNSNVLLYDRAPDGAESLWSQMASSAVTGAKSGQALGRMPMEVTSWADWLARHPETLVLSLDTGHPRQYNRRVYQGYFSKPDLMFPVEPLDERMPAKSPVLGVTSGKVHRAYALSTFVGQEAGTFIDTLDGHRLTLVYSPKHQSLRIEQADAGLEWMYSFWFAWSAFNPETDIYKLP